MIIEINYSNNNIININNNNILSKMYSVISIYINI